MAFKKHINRDPIAGGGGGGTVTPIEISLENIDMIQPNDPNAPPVDPRLAPPNPPPLVDHNAPPVNPPPAPPPSTPPATPVEETIEIDNVEYKLDDKGNALDKDGKIFMDKAKLDALAAEQDDTPVTENIIKLYGFHPLDEKGQPKVYADTEESVIQIGMDIAKTEYAKLTKSFEEKYPDARDFFEAQEKGIIREFYEKKLANWSNRKFDETSESDCLSVIIDDLVAKGTDRKEAGEIAQIWKDKGDDVLKQKGKAAFESRKAVESAAKAQEENARLAAIADEDKYWNEFWNKREIIIKAGKLRDIVIPEAERDSFLAFMSAPTENGKSALQNKITELGQKNPEILLQLDYLLFNDFKLDKLVKNAASTERVKTLKARLRTKKVENPANPSQPAALGANIPEIKDLDRN